ncbi:MAG: RHS repeat protein [Gemmatimonadetes bacterium]|nr:RHS repeat protein [Gemmatimonadota bacterium]
MWKRTLKNQTVLRYDYGNGRLLAATEPVGTQAMLYWGTNTYDGVRLDSLVDEAGKVVRFSYTNGRLSSVKIPGAPVTNVYIASGGALDSIADPDGVKTKFVYGAGRYRMTSRTGRRTGETTTFTYATAKDTVALLASIGIPDGPLTHTAYQREGLSAPGTGTSAAPATPGLPANAVVTLRDVRGIATRVSVDRLGRPTRVATADSGIVTITRDAATSLPTRMEWTPFGRRVDFFWNFTVADLDSTVAHSSVEWNGQTAKTAYQYHPTFHALTQVTTPLGLVTRYEYDPATSLLLRAIAPGNDTTSFQYNAQGQVTRIDEPGHTQPTEYGYDAVAKNLSWAMSPQGHVSTGQDYRDSTRYVYDTSGTVVLRVAVPRGLGAVDTMKHFYDALHRDTLVETWSAGGVRQRQVKTKVLTGERTVQYTVPSSSAPLGRTITQNLDAMGRPTSECTPAMGGACHTFYISQGLLQSMTVAGGWARRTWYYDSLGRVKEFDFTAPSGQTQWSGKAAPADSVKFQYNQLGALTRAENSRSIVQRAYYTSGRLACEFQTIKRWDNLSATNAHRFAVHYFYDRDGRLERKSFGGGVNFYDYVGPTACQLGSDMASIRYHYDARGRVDSLIGIGLEQDSTIRFAIAYDAAGRRTRLTQNPSLPI